MYVSKMRYFFKVVCLMQLLISVASEQHCAHIKVMSPALNNGALCVIENTMQTVRFDVINTCDDVRASDFVITVDRKNAESSNAWYPLCIVGVNLRADGCSCLRGDGGAVVSCEMTEQFSREMTKYRLSSEGKLESLYFDVCFNAVNGQWGSWSSYGSCSKTCGDGTKTRTRTCDNPAPAYGGADCAGSDYETATCNLQECRPPTIAVKKKATLEFSVTSQAVVPFDLTSYTTNVIGCHATMTTFPVTTNRYDNTMVTPVVTDRDCLSDIKVKGTPPDLEMNLTLTIATGHKENWTLSVANDEGSSKVTFAVRYMDVVCVRLKTATDTVYAESNSQVTVNVAIEERCSAYHVANVFIKAVVQRENAPDTQTICSMLYKNGSCLHSDNCGCTPKGFSVSRTVGDGGRERWMISGFDQNMQDQRAELLVDIVIKDSRLVTIILSVVIPLVVIIIVSLVVFVCRRRHVSGQVNPSPAEVAMVPLYSRLDQDVHHYLGLPPNRHAPTGDDEGGYLDLVDSDSEFRPESGIYQVPGEWPSPSNAPDDYLNPVASAQEGPKLPKRRAPADYLHPVASAQEQPLSPSNADEDYLHPVASAQAQPLSPSNAPEDYLHPVASAQEQPLSPSNAPADDLDLMASAQEPHSSPSNAPADDLDPMASAQEQPLSPKKARPENNLDPVASAQEPPLSHSNAPADDLDPMVSAQEPTLSPSNAPADDLDPEASDQERPSSPSNAHLEDNLDPVALAQERPSSPSNA